MDKASALAEFKSLITRDLGSQGHQSWFWPRWNGVSGFEGTAPITFVALNPSMGHFPSRADQLFYECLAKNGLADAHLTDVLKCKARNADVSAILADDALMNLHQQWLLAEMQIIRPRLIVAVGLTDTFNVLAKWFPGDGSLRAIPHYAWAKRWGHEARFAQAMADLGAEIPSLVTTG